MRGLAMAGRCMKFFEANTRNFLSPLTWSFGGAYKFHGNLVLCEYHKHHKWNDSQDFGVSLIAKLGRSCSTNTAVQLNVHKKKIIPASPPPRADEIASLYQFVQGSQKLAILTGAGVSTESGIPDYRSPNGAYSTGFKPITHQEFVRSERSRRRYWARSYAGWQRFNSAQPGPTHRAIAQLESRGYVESIITQNVDRLHHCAGSNPLELHGTTHEVICLSCSDLTSRHEFQERVKELNPEWALAMEALENGEAVSNVGMQQRPDGDIEIDERFWEEKFQVPLCKLCGGLLKPNVVLFGDNLPKSRAETALAMVNSADALLVVGSSLMVLSAFRLAKTAHEKGIPLAIINVGPTRADALASLKIECRSGEILSRVLDCGSLGVPHVAVDPNTDVYTKVVPN